MHKFNVSSGKIQVTDPCYNIEIWCAHTLENVKDGIYHATTVKNNVGQWGDRIFELNIKHESVLNKKRLRYRRLDVVIGVDSGQAGFFDYNYLRDQKLSEELDMSFYHQVCEFTNTADQFSGNEHYVVSSSGYGDGSYSLQVAEDNGKIVAAKLVFIDEQDIDPL